MVCFSRLSIREAAHEAALVFLVKRLSIGIHRGNKAKLGDKLTIKSYNSTQITTPTNWGVTTTKTPSDLIGMLIDYQSNKEAA